MSYVVRRWERAARAEGLLEPTERVGGGWLCDVDEIVQGESAPEWAWKMHRRSWKSFGVNTGLLVVTDQSLIVSAATATLRHDLLHLGVVHAGLPNRVTVEVLTNPCTTIRMVTVKPADAVAACAVIETARQRQWSEWTNPALDQVRAELGEDIANEMLARWVLADPARPTQGAAALVLGERLQSRGHLAEAERLFRQAAGDANHDTARDAAALLGRLLRDAGDDSGAEDAYREVLALGSTGSDAARARLQLGTLHANRDDAAAAHDALDRILDDTAASDLHPEALHALAKMHDRRGEPDQAESAYRQLAAIPLAPWTQIGQAGMARFSTRRGDLDTAISLYRAVLTSGAGGAMPPAAGIDLAALLRQQGRVDEAVRTYQQVIALADPTQTAAAWLGLGDIYRDRNEPTQAREAYRNADTTAEPTIANRARKALRQLP